MSDDGNFFANITQLMCQTWSLQLWFHQKYPQKILTVKIFFYTTTLYFIFTRKGKITKIVEN